MSNKIIAIGAFSAALAVALGAFGAHALKPILTPDKLESYKTGVQYQFYHAIGLILFGLFGKWTKHSIKNLSAWFFIAGTVLFSFNMYTYVFTGILAFAIILPLGGICFMLGWLSFAWQAWKSKF